MTILRRGALLLLASMATMASMAAVAGAVDATPEARVIVTLKADAPLMREQALSVRQSASAAAATVQRRAERLAARAGMTLVAGAAISARAQVVMAQGVSAQTLASRLAADPEVASAVVDQRRRALRIPNDPLFALGPVSGRGPDAGQWYLRAPDGDRVSAVNAEAAWDLLTGQPSVVVAVLDTGVLGNHLDLQGRVLPGYDMVSDAAIANDGDGRDADASDAGDWITPAEDSASGGRFNGCGSDDSSWHGTEVAGIIAAAADNGLGMAGTAHGVHILPVRVLGKCGGFDSDIQAGMRWAAGLEVPGVPRNLNPARIINMSLGSSGACDASTGYAQVVAELLAAGTTVVAAAGNSAGHAVGLPANCPGVVAVAALRHAGSKVGFSDLGQQIALSAPGGNCVNIGPGDACLYPILSSSNSGTQGPNAGGSIWTDSFNISVGTSFSAPIVAGVAALMLSAQPALTPAELRSALLASTRPFPTQGAGNDEDGQPVPMCRVPDGSDQLQCYCSAGLCGAGMVNALGAVTAASATIARIELEPAAVQPGDSLRLSAAGSLAGVGRGIVAYSWSLIDGGGVVNGFLGASNAAEAFVQPSGEGTFVVQLTVGDDNGAQASVQRTVTVAAATPAPPPAGPTGGGGGASSVVWVLLLALAVVALRASEVVSKRSLRNG
ncbi:MAG: S8 family serine peptidase [Rubrivivax sp.]